MTVDRSLHTQLRPRDRCGRLAARTITEYAAAFYARIQMTDRDNCWPWTGPVDAKGYGMVARCSVMPEKRAHRVVYRLLVGRIPPGHIVMHSCDNPRCCNPSHLSPGTNLDNTRDSMRKGRRAPPPTMKLMPDEVREIRAIGDTLTRKEIAARYGISGRNVLSILRRESWAHIP